MFFKKFFSKKTCSDHESRGDTLLEQERYADARLAYEDAIACVQETDEASDPQLRERLTKKFDTTGYHLAVLNIREARSAKASGDIEKAEEYLDMAARFSQDPAISRDIAEIINNSTLSAPEVNKNAGAHNCSSCTSPEAQHIEIKENRMQELPVAEQFEILISPLPDGLPAVYRSLGEEFASAYICAHNGDLDTAYATYEHLHNQSPSDICLYEMAIIKAHHGAIRDTERLLKESLTVNPSNPLSCLSLVQLYSDQRRFGEARAMLDRMHAEGILGNQVLLMLGDVSMSVGSLGEAEEFYRRALEDKALASTAAERLIPLLEQSGRFPERDYLAKKHCGKGCC
jgi:pentatricopeptide repeat protein